MKPRCYNVHECYECNQRLENRCVSCFLKYRFSSLKNPEKLDLSQIEFSGGLPWLKKQCGY